MVLEGVVMLERKQETNARERSGAVVGKERGGS